MIDIRRFRRVQTIVSITVFILVFLLCWNLTGFNLRDIQLSYWGVDSKMGWFWNICLVMLSFSIYFNVYHYIKTHKRIEYKRGLQMVFLLVSLSLFLIGAVNMHHWLHNVAAVFYFFAYPLAIFLLAHFNRKHLQYKEWKYHLIASVSMVVGTLLFLSLFHGMAISETVHIGIAIIWNLWILMDD